MQDLEYSFFWLATAITAPDPQGLLRRAAALTGIARENVYVHTTFQGGGYGSNGNGPQGEQAVAVANAVRGRPVKMLWTREEDWGTGTKYRPMGVCFLKAGLDAGGWPIAIEVRHATTWRATRGSAGCRRRLISCRTTALGSLPDDPRSDGRRIRIANYRAPLRRDSLVGGGASRWKRF